MFLLFAINFNRILLSSASITIAYDLLFKIIEIPYENICYKYIHIFTITLTLTQREGGYFFMHLFASIDNVCIQGGEE